MYTVIFFFFISHELGVIYVLSGNINNFITRFYFIVLTRFLIFRSLFFFFFILIFTPRFFLFYIDFWYWNVVIYEIRFSNKFPKNVFFFPGIYTYWFLKPCEYFLNAKRIRNPCAAHTGSGNVPCVVDIEMYPFGDASPEIVKLVGD